MPASRTRTALGIIGPSGFVAAWVISGARTKSYSPVDDAISLLAATDARTRWWMTAGFVSFGVGVPVFSTVLRRAIPGPAWIAATTSGVATLGVAAFPLHVSTTVDRAHGTCAGIGYIALALVPLLAAGTLASEGHHRAALLSRLVAAVSAASLVVTPFTEANGLFQRLGLTVVDVWLVATAVTLLRWPAATRQNDAR